MHTFKKFFNTARIPGEEIDSIVNYFKTGKEYGEEGVQIEK